MTISPVVLQPGIVLTTGAVALVTGPANGKAVVTRVVASNATGGAITVTFYRVPNGGTAGATNLIIDGRSIAAAPGTDLLPELAGMVLNSGDTIQGLASAGTSINVFASGYTVT